MILCGRRGHHPAQTGPRYDTLWQSIFFIKVKLGWEDVSWNCQSQWELLPFGSAILGHNLHRGRHYHSVHWPIVWNIIIKAQQLLEISQFTWRKLNVRIDHQQWPRLSVGFGCHGKGNGIWVTDGSYMEEISPGVSGAGSVFHCTVANHCLCGSFFEVFEQASFSRAERLGLFAIHVLVSSITQFFNFTSVKIFISCDQKGRFYSLLSARRVSRQEAYRQIWTGWWEH